MNKKRPFKQKFLKLFWTHIFIILSFLYFVSSDINGIKQNLKTHEKGDVNLKETNIDQSMCNEDNCNEDNIDTDNQEPLALKADNDEYRNNTDGRLEEDLEHPDDQMTSDITGVITTTEKLISTTETTVRPTQPRPVRQKPPPNARRYLKLLY